MPWYLSYKRGYPEINAENNMKITILSLRAGICIIFLAIAVPAHALNLDRIKSVFIAGDYKQAISEGERILAVTTAKAYGLDELYYILALSYLKDGNYLRASDIFEIILKEFKKSTLAADARLGLADTCFLKGDYERAREGYGKLLNSGKAVRLRPCVYYRLSRCAAELGHNDEAENYLAQLKREFPLNILDSKDNIISGESYYSVQVGSFSSNTNANNLMRQLIDKGYSAYIEEANLESETVYRVKVGRSGIKETMALATRLSREGYPTKVCP